MAIPPDHGKTPGVEERLARVEALLVDQHDKAEKSPVQRAIKFLPLLAVSNFLVAVPAFILSVAIAYFTFIGAEATEKMQIASVWPRVAYISTNQSESGDEVMRLSLTNKGVGPATIKGMEIRYGGRAYGALRDLLAACCTGDATALPIAVGSVVGEVLRPGEDLMFVQLDPAKLPAETWTRLNQERLKFDVRVCYCSVFDDCWVAEDNSTRVRAVASCPTNWTQYYGSSELEPSQK